MARLLDQIPREMVLIGIQPACIEMDTELTPAVARQLGAMKASVLAELAALGIAALPL